jgi:N-Acetylglucosaminyltransferase-IV (GnT-IV) conserved region
LVGMIVQGRHSKRHHNSHAWCWMTRSLSWRFFQCTLALWFLTVIATFVHNRRQAVPKGGAQLSAPVKPASRLNVASSRASSSGNNRPLRLPHGPPENDSENESSVLVLITQPYGASLPALEATTRNALSNSTRRIKVLVYAATADALQALQQTFAVAVRDERLLVYGMEHMGPTVSQRLQDDLNMAYLIQLASQYGKDYEFTMLLRAGMRIATATSTDSTKYGRYSNDYAALAVQHYRFVQAERSLGHDLNRTCVTLLSQEADAKVLHALLFETTEHAARMAMVLRSTLPYQAKQSTEIVDYYCRRILWEAQRVVGPVLFRNELPTDPTYQTLPFIAPFLNASQFPLPPWIDSSIPVGPVLYKGTPNFTIAFGVTTMTRPVKGNEYLIQFMKEMLDMVETTFTSTLPNGAKRSEAVIVLLVSGNTREDIVTHRAFLETTYDTAIARGIVVLVDAPLLSYTAKLQHLRLTFAEDRAERRYWRSKQNLDIAAMLDATARMSSYIMLLEDDTGFQPGFAASLKTTLQPQIHDPNGIPSWPAVEYGFGYSGVLMHASDVRVFQQIHATFYDEQPCDLFKIDKLIRKAQISQIISHKEFANNKVSFLKHNGKVSSLEGKEQ